MPAEKTDTYALIIQPGAVGDGILTIPLARLLRAEANIDHVDMMGHRENLTMLQGRSEIEDVIAMEEAELYRLFVDNESFDLPEGDPLIAAFSHYDMIVTFLGDTEGHFERNLIATAFMSHPAEVVTLQLRPDDAYTGHATQFFMEQLVGQMPERSLTLREDFTASPLIRTQLKDAERGRRVLLKNGIEPQYQPVVLHPGSGGAAKCWPLDKYRLLASLSAENGYQPILLVGPAEQERWGDGIIEQLRGEMPLLMGLTLEEVLGVLSCAAGYVGNDSGISHLAGALNLETVAIFGPSNPVHWHPVGQKVACCRAKKQPETDWPEVEEVWRTLQGLI